MAIGPTATLDTAAPYDVVILGAGLAGLSLTRHLLLETDKRILLVERRDPVPSGRQKVGESSVQVGGYYYSRVLDLEEYLWRHHYMKYNLRFYWRSGGGSSGDRDNSRFEDYSQAYIRNFSNIPSYQLDRNVFEQDLIQMNLESGRVAMVKGIRKLQVDLADDGPHTVRFEHDGASQQVQGTWVVDCTGRNKIMAKDLGLRKANSVRHAAFFWWVDGLVDVDRLTDLTPSEIRKKPQRRHQGHLPTWLATNHFCDEGLWFWVIPLQGKTSLGLVFDKEVVDFQLKDVLSPEKATRFVCERFPCLARDLPQREILDFGGYADFSHDCERTIHPQRWAISGEAGRFSDPLYSPGSDLIAIHNTLIVNAIQSGETEDLEAQCRLYEPLMKAVYQAYIPTYAESYDTLGDAEVFSLKYTWELTVYFALYVFPFINDFLTDRRFVLTFMRLFSRLGPINLGVQKLLSGYYQWKKERFEPPVEPVFHDFMSLGPLAAAEKTFYEVGVSVDDGKAILTQQVKNLEELARFTAAWVASVVVDEPRLLSNAAYVQAIDVQRLDFDAESIRAQWQACRNVPGEHVWSFDPSVLDGFRQPAETSQPLLERVAS